MKVYEKGVEFGLGQWWIRSLSRIGLSCWKDKKVALVITKGTFSIQGIGDGECCNASTILSATFSLIFGFLNTNDWLLTILKDMSE